MINRLRTPFFIATIVLIFLTILIETGTALPGVLLITPLSLTAYQPLPQQVSSAASALDNNQRDTLAQLKQQDRPAGLSIPNLALLDSIVLFTLALMGVALLLPARLQSRIQGIATLLFSLLLLGFAIRQIFAALGLLILMVALCLSIPFGTIIYLILYGSFNRAGADVVLGLIMLLKFAFSGSLILAQQRFLQSKGLILLVLTSFLNTLIISFLLGLVPGFLVSITDAIAALIVGVIAAIWGIILLIGSLTSIIKLVHL